MIRVLLGLLLAVAAGAAPLELEVWEFPRISSEEQPHDRYAWMRSLLAEYRERHPEVRIRLTELTWKAGGEKLRIALFSGRPPDIVSGALDPALVRSGQVDAIDAHLSEADRADYLPGALESFRVGEATVAWPWCRTGDFLYLNLEVFEKAGIAPPTDGRWTPESWRRACAALREVPKTYPLGMALAPGKSAELSLALGPGGVLVDGRGGYDFSGPAARASLERLARWKADGWVPPNSPGWSAKDLWLALTRDRSVAMAPFGLWAVKGLEKQAGFPWALAELPPGEGGPSMKPAATVGYYVLKRPGRSEEGTRAAHALARYLSGPAGQAYLARYGQFPTRASVGELYPDRPAMRRAAKLLAGSRPVPVHPAWESLDEAFKRRLQSFLLEGGDPGETLARLEQQAAGLLAPGAEAGDAPGWFRLLCLLIGGLALLAGLRFMHGLTREGLAPLVLAAPALAVLGLFFLVPAVQGILLAFRDVTPGSGPFEGWVGLDNFRRTLGDEGFRVGCRNTVLYAAVVVPGNLLMGLVLASMIYPLAKRARAVFRGAFYLPGVCSVVAMAIVWRQLLDERVGLFNRALASLGGAGRLAQGFLPCLERVPVALMLVFGVAVTTTLFMHRPGGEREPIRRRWERDLAVLGAAGLGLVWVLLGFAAPEAAAPVPWLTSKQLSFYSVLLMVLVRGPGGALLVYLAALEAVDPELYEAAEVDGAGALQRFYHVTMPSLAPTTFFLAVTGVIDSFQAFGPVFLLTDGGPGFSSTVVVHRMYLSAFRDLDFGLAAAQGTLLFLVVAAIGVAQSWGRER